MREGGKMSGIYNSSKEDRFHEQQLNKHLDETYGDESYEDEPPRVERNRVAAIVTVADEDVWTTGYVIGTVFYCNITGKSYLGGEWEIAEKTN